MAIGVKVLKRPERDVSYVRATLKGMALTFKKMFEPKVTMQYPEEKSAPEAERGAWSLAPRWRGTHRMLTDEQGRSKCVACGLCPQICPANCIKLVPGEDEQAFANTRQTAERLPFSYCHVFSYSTRPGTAATRLEDRLPPDVIRNRSRTLAELSRTKALAFYQRHIGRTESVLFEQGDRDGFRTGTTGNFTRVAVPAGSAAAGTIHPVTITGVMDGLAYGHLAAPSAESARRSLL